MNLADLNLANHTQSGKLPSAETATLTAAPVLQAPAVQAPAHARSVESIFAPQSRLAEGFDVTFILILLSLLGHVILGAGVNYFEQSKAHRLNPAPEAISVELVEDKPPVDEPSPPPRIAEQISPAAQQPLQAEPAPQAPDSIVKLEPQAQLAQAPNALAQDGPKIDEPKTSDAPPSQEALKAPEPEISAPQEPRPVATQAPVQLAEPIPVPEQAPVVEPAPRVEPAPVAEPAPEVEPAKKPQAAPRRPTLPPSLTRPLPDAPEVQFLPDAFRVIATDQEPGLSARDNENYKALVFERLIAAKLYPAAARQRRAKGIALVNFMLDSAGQVAGVSLIRSSGDGDLDREALAMVKRAAPYPPPPSGAVRLFSPLIEFGSEDQEPSVNPSARP